MRFIGGRCKRKGKMGTDIHGVFQRRNGSKWEDIPSKYEQNRHYLLFAWLGNVRNGFGCAGVPTHTEITPLSDCRGLPDAFDGSDEHDIGDHSFSWVSADEVISTTPPKILRTGIVPRSAFDAWDGTSSPGAWCRSEERRVGKECRS